MTDTKKCPAFLDSIKTLKVLPPPRAAPPFLDRADIIVTADGVNYSLTVPASYEGLSGGDLGLLFGGIISIPWLVAIAIIVHFYGGLIERHPIAFAIIGPVIVSGTYALLVGPFWHEAAISSVVSSACYIPFAFWQRRRLTALD